MKFSTASLIALVCAPLVLANPAPSPQSTIYPRAAIGSARSLEARSVRGEVLVDGLGYRPCPRVDDSECPAAGQYAKGTPIDIDCLTRDNTTPVNGDSGWVRLTNGYYVAMAWGEYISWSDYLDYC